MTELHPQQDYPFEREYCEWCDAEYSVTVTYQTMKYHLWTVWFSHCVYHYSEDPENEVESTQDWIVNHTRFHPEELKAPGIHREGGDGDDHTNYFILVPDSRLRRRGCDEWLNRLNEQYGESFELHY